MKPELLGDILINISSNSLGFFRFSIGLFILYIIVHNQWNFAAATRLLRIIKERLRPRRHSRGGSDPPRGKRVAVAQWNKLFLPTQLMSKE
jgi:hypothetical protein